MVPIVRDVDRKSFAQIEKDIAALAQKAREGKITVNDLQGGTFTITNGGVFGSPPEHADYQSSAERYPWHAHEFRSVPSRSMMRW